MRLYARYERPRFHCSIPSSGVHGWRCMHDSLCCSLSFLVPFSLLPWHYLTPCCSLTLLQHPTVHNVRTVHSSPHSASAFSHTATAWVCVWQDRLSSFGNNHEIRSPGRSDWCGQLMWQRQAQLQCLHQCYAVCLSHFVLLFRLLWPPFFLVVVGTGIHPCNRFHTVSRCLIAVFCKLEASFLTHSFIRVASLTVVLCCCSRDIKSMNVLFDKTTGRAKLAGKSCVPSTGVIPNGQLYFCTDFGHARKLVDVGTNEKKKISVDCDATHMMTSQRGTVQVCHSCQSDVLELILLCRSGWHPSCAKTSLKSRANTKGSHCHVLPIRPLENTLLKFLSDWVQSNSRKPMNTRESTRTCDTAWRLMCTPLVSGVQSSHFWTLFQVSWCMNFWHTNHHGSLSWTRAMFYSKWLVTNGLKWTKPSQLIHLQVHDWLVVSIVQPSCVCNVSAWDFAFESKLWLGDLMLYVQVG